MMRFHCLMSNLITADYEIWKNWRHTSFAVGTKVKRSLVKISFFKWEKNFWKVKKIVKSIQVYFELQVNCQQKISVLLSTRSQNNSKSCKPSKTSRDASTNYLWDLFIRTKKIQERYLTSKFARDLKTLYRKQRSHSDFHFFRGGGVRQEWKFSAESFWFFSK